MPLRVPMSLRDFSKGAFPGVASSWLHRSPKRKEKSEVKQRRVSERETNGEKVPCHFRQFKGPFRPHNLPRTAGSRYSVPHRTLPTSAPGLPPPSPRRSEVNRRRGLKTTPTFSHNPPYHGYSISFHYAPCSTDHPSRPSLPPFLAPVSFSLASLQPPVVVLLTSSLSLTSRRSYHGDETRTPTNFYCYFSRRFLWPPHFHRLVQRLLLSLFLCAF